MLSITSCGSNQVIEMSNISWRRSMPLRASENQDTKWASNVLFGGERFPPLELRLIELNDVHFYIGDGKDGIITTAESIPIEETTYFSLLGRADADYAKILGVGDYSVKKMDQVFLGFDSGWTNYFHWICYALPKAVISLQILPPEVEIVFPDYVERSQSSSPLEWRLSFTEGVWKDSLNFFGLEGRASFLPPGRYFAKKLYTLWTQSSSPTEFLQTNAFAKVFNNLRKHLPNIVSDSPEIFVSRKLAADRRLDTESESLILEFLKETGITSVNLEELSFKDQINLFNSSDLVISPHGAGLVNLVFGTPRLQVLELNRLMPRDDKMRPWFYMLCSVFNLTYMYLDGTGRTFTTEELGTALERLRAARQT